MKKGTPGRSGKWVLEALQLVASPVTPMDAMADVCFLGYPRGTRKAEQVRAGRLWPKNNLGEQIMEAPELVRPSPLTGSCEGTGLVPTQDWSAETTAEDTFAAPEVWTPDEKEPPVTGTQLPFCRFSHR